MIDVLLINTPVFFSYRDPNARKNVPPLGLGYIYTQLIQNDLECVFLDCVAESVIPDELIEIINSSGAHFVAMNVFSSNLEIIHFTLEKISKEIKIILGGPAIKFQVNEILNWSIKREIIIISGEAEIILPYVIKAPTCFGEKIRNIRFINVSASTKYFPKNIDLPLDRKIFHNEPVVKENLGITESYVISSRGCLFNCSFCTAGTSINKSYPRFRTSRSLKKEISDILKSNPEINCIRVLDDLFIRDNDSINFAINVFNDFGIKWRSMAHVAVLKNTSERTILKIKESGCCELFLGIESGDDAILQNMKKPFTANIAKRTILKLLNSGIQVKCYFILGYPGETKNQAENTIKLASEIKENSIKIGTSIRFSPFRFRPYHGTQIYKTLVNSNKLISPIRNRADLKSYDISNPYDCISGLYSDYSESDLDFFMEKMENLNV